MGFCLRAAGHGFFICYLPLSMEVGHSSADYALTAGGAELLERVGPLWLQLRQHHAEVSSRWAGQLMKFSFDERRDGLIAKSTGGLLILLATGDGRDVGYCVSTISADRHGEIDSIYILSTHRRLGIGHAMMSRTLDWFKQQSVRSISVDVMIGNETALPFYARYGFHPRTLRLRQNGGIC